MKQIGAFAKIFLFLAVLIAFISIPAFAQSQYLILEEESYCRWSRDLLLEQARYFLTAEPTLNYVEFTTSSVNDTYYDSYGTWGQSYDDMWGLKRLNIEDAWKLSTGEGVTVAVLDSGIDYNHTDITTNIWTNNAELNGTAGVDDDDNGYVDDIRGWDFHYRDNSPMDGHGHGTHVAGIIGAEGNNNEGIIGIAYESNLMPVKIISDVDTAYADRIAAGIRYAADMGIKIINCSIGMPYYSEIVSAFRYAYEKGCIIIAAAGNNYGAINEYPATLDYVVTVGSIGEDNTRSDFSSYGSDLDVVAPGEDILSLRAEGTDMPLRLGYSPGYNFVPDDPDAEYCWLHGTSMAAPFVSGLAALMMSQTPTLTYDDFMRRLHFSSVDLGATGWDQYYGWGRIDAFAALSYDWYDSGIMKTWWLTEPDGDYAVRYDYYLSSRMKYKWFDSASPDSVHKYVYYDEMISRMRCAYNQDSTILLYNEYHGTTLTPKTIQEHSAGWELLTTYEYYSSSNMKAKEWANPSGGDRRYVYYDEGAGRKRARCRTDGTIFLYTEYHGSTDTPKTIQQYDSGWDLVKTYTYHSSGNLKTIDYANPTGSTKREVYYDESFYGNIGRLRCVYETDGDIYLFNAYHGSTDTRKYMQHFDSNWNLITSYEYFASGQLKSKEYANPTGDDKKYVYYDEDFYGDHGRLRCAYKTDGTIYLYTEYHPGSGQAKYVEEYDSSWNWIATYEYDSGGTLIGPLTSVRVYSTSDFVDFQAELNNRKTDENAKYTTTPQMVIPSAGLKL